MRITLIKCQHLLSAYHAPGTMSTLIMSLRLLGDIVVCVLSLSLPHQ